MYNFTSRITAGLGSFRSGVIHVFIINVYMYNNICSTSGLVSRVAKSSPSCGICGSNVQGGDMADRSKSSKRLCVCFGEVRGQQRGQLLYQNIFGADTHSLSCCWQGQRL